MNEDRLLIDRRTLSLVRDFVPEQDALEGIADFFSALSDVTRIKLVSALAITQMCVNDLSTVLGLNQTTVSHQLKNLRSIGVVKVKRQGKVAFYSLSDPSVLELMNKAVDFL